MSFQPPFLRPRRRLTGLAVTLALHLLVVYFWSRPHEPRLESDSTDPQRIQWVTVPAPRPVKAKPVAAREPAPAPVSRTAAPVVTHTPPAAVTEPDAAPQPVVEAPPAPRVEDMMRQARKDLGRIDKELQKEFPGARIKAPPDSPQIRLVKGIEHAAEMAPPKWYEANKVQEIIDPGGYGRRRYRVITANGTYCITVESNHAPDGIDTMKNGIKPKLTTCPEHETPSNPQKW